MPRLALSAPYPGIAFSAELSSALGADRQGDRGRHERDGDEAEADPPTRRLPARDATIGEEEQRGGGQEAPAARPARARRESNQNSSRQPDLSAASAAPTAAALPWLRTGTALGWPPGTGPGPARPRRSRRTGPSPRPPPPPATAPPGGRGRGPCSPARQGRRRVVVRRVGFGFPGWLGRRVGPVMLRARWVRRRIATYSSASSMRPAGRTGGAEAAAWRASFASVSSSVLLLHARRSCTPELMLRCMQAAQQRRRTRAVQVDFLEGFVHGVDEPPRRDEAPEGALPDGGRAADGVAGADGLKRLMKQGRRGRRAERRPPGSAERAGRRAAAAGAVRA